MNKVILMGRLARELEIRYSHGDCKITLAVDSRFGMQWETDLLALKGFIGNMVTGVLQFLWISTEASKDRRAGYDRGR